MIQNLITHTRRLLVSGVFDHLTDEKLSNLHSIIISSNQGICDIKELLSFWRDGDFSDNIQSMQLMQVTNSILSSFGEPAIGEIFEEEPFY